VRQLLEPAVVDPETRERVLAGAAGSARPVFEPLSGDPAAELHATGARPRASDMSGPDALTPSERRVADLAAEGQTNRDIAQALFVTPKTVEVHLSNTYRKLGTGSRRELARALEP
jgi:DNA-binding NarL/FixJ family response regulator